MKPAAACGTAAPAATEPPLAARSQALPAFYQSLQLRFKAKQHGKEPQPPSAPYGRLTARARARMSTHPVAVERRALLKYILQVGGGVATGGVVHAASALAARSRRTLSSA